jgi:hypothetical protein
VCPSSFIDRRRVRRIPNALHRSKVLKHGHCRVRTSSIGADRGDDGIWIYGLVGSCSTSSTIPRLHRARAIDFVTNKASVIAYLTAGQIASGWSACVGRISPSTMAAASLLNQPGRRRLRRHPPSASRLIRWINYARPGGSKRTSTPAHVL